MNTADSISPGERLAIRSRPPGSPLMHQNWENLLFLHWPVDPQSLRRLVPARLALDTFDGTAWIGITPFELSGLRPIGLPAIPGISSFYELNVRTYVHYDRVPGLWFLSLYASKILPVLGARWTFSLPYRTAEMSVRTAAGRTHYSLRRGGERAAEFQAEWEVGKSLPSPSAESLEFFLMERYCLYAAEGERLFRCRVHHVPWLIHSAALGSHRSNLIAVEGIPEPSEAPLVHYGGDQDVDVWPLEEL